MDNPKHGLKRLKLETLISKAAGDTREQRILAVMRGIDRKLAKSGLKPAETFAETEGELVIQWDILERLWHEAVNCPCQE